MIEIDFVKKKVRKLIKSNIGSYYNPRQLTYSQVEENPTWYHYIFTLIHIIYMYKLQFYENENITQIGLLLSINPVTMLWVWSVLFDDIFYMMNTHSSTCDVIPELYLFRFSLFQNIFVDDNWYWIKSILWKGIWGRGR